MSLLDDIDSIAARLQAEAELVTSLVDPSSRTDAIGRIEAVRGLIATTRTALNALDVDALTQVRTAREYLAAGSWIHGSSFRLVQLDGLAADLVARIRDANAGGYRQRTYVVRDGDTLERIASRELGDWTLAARIASANRLAPNATLTVGTTLVIPTGE